MSTIFKHWYVQITSTYFWCCWGRGNTNFRSWRRTFGGPKFFKFACVVDMQAQCLEVAQYLKILVLCDNINFMWHFEVGRGAGAGLRRKLHMMLLQDEIDWGVASKGRLSRDLGSRTNQGNTLVNETDLETCVACKNSFVWNNERKLLFNFAIFTEKHPKTLHQNCFPVNIAKFLRKPI